MFRRTTVGAAGSSDQSEMPVGGCTCGVAHAALSKRLQTLEEVAEHDHRRVVGARPPLLRESRPIVAHVRVKPSVRRSVVRRSVLDDRWSWGFHHCRWYGKHCRHQLNALDHMSWCTLLCGGKCCALNYRWHEAFHDMRWVGDHHCRRHRHGLWYHTCKFFSDSRYYLVQSILVALVSLQGFPLLSEKPLTRVHRLSSIPFWSSHRLLHSRRGEDNLGRTCLHSLVVNCLIRHLPLRHDLRRGYVVKLDVILLSTLSWCWTAIDSSLIHDRGPPVRDIVHTCMRCDHVAQVVP